MSDSLMILIALNLITWSIVFFQKCKLKKNRKEIERLKGEIYGN